MIKANIIGAGGYGGVGILELLLRHPEAEVGVLIDIENAGRPIADLFPHLLTLQMKRHTSRPTSYSWQHRTEWG